MDFHSYAQQVRTNYGYCATLPKGIDKQFEKIIFRGSPTGGCHTFDKEKQEVLMADGNVMPRFAVVKLSKKIGRLLNARFSSAPPDCFPKELERLKMVDTKKIDDKAHACYAAIIVPYGNSVADRLARQLALGMPIIMMRGRSDVDEFWYDEAINGTHWYEADTDNLEVVLRGIMATNNQRMSNQKRKERAQVGINGRQFVEERLSERRLKCYIYTLLKGYGKIWRKKYPDG